ncbi:hypothetical protein NDU88_004524 [Pleurodeles waltl]|uniref:Uncharacterized protein n=1 Tax=Pleurodeles waltl TaxID=8319 RepID=A0AAV7VGG8_PLEWA|nr:hypothetical protein NDU88_004524 [Pleurodeles waltl]
MSQKSNTEGYRAGKRLFWFIKQDIHAAPAVSLYIRPDMTLYTQKLILDAFYTYYPKVYDNTYKSATGAADHFLAPFTLLHLPGDRQAILDGLLTKQETKAAVQDLATGNTPDMVGIGSP